MLVSLIWNLRTLGRAEPRCIGNGGSELIRPFRVSGFTCSTLKMGFFPVGLGNKNKQNGHHKHD